MKLFASLFFSLCTIVAFGAPVGNSALPNIVQKGIILSSDCWLDFRFGYEGDFVTDARMDQSEKGSDRVDYYKQNTNSGTVTFNFVDRMDIYGVFGASNTKAHWRYEETDSEIIHRLKLATDDNFLWAVGARAILYQWWHLTLGLGGRYSYSHYYPKRVSLDDVEIPVAGTHFLWRQWQLNLDMSYKIDLFTPYLGFKYSNVRAGLGNFPVSISINGSGSSELVNRIPFGLFLGCSISTGEYGMLNIEGRLIDEEAVTISAEFRF